MKKIIYNISAIATFILFVLNVSCSNDSIDNIDSGLDNLSISFSFSKLNTRALSTEDGDHDGNFNENKISHLDVFFYDGNILKWHIDNTNMSYDTGTGVATIPVVSDKKALFENNSTSYDIYVVANNSADLSSILEGANNLNTLKNLIFQTNDLVSKGGSTGQSLFVMDGKISKVININNPIIGTVDLKRAASKIRLNVSNVNVPGYSLGSANMSAQLINFLDKSALMDESTPFAPNNNDWRSTQPRAIDATSKTTLAPFYAYENSWVLDSEKETYIELFVPLIDNNTNVEQTYKYYIPITPQNLTGSDAVYMNNLQRNLLYDIDVVIKILGSIEEPPIEVAGNYIIKDWTTQEILVDIKGSHYLVVSENIIVMPNINQYTITFNSSIPNVTLVPNSLTAKYTYINVSTGLPVTNNVANNQMPTISVQPNTAAGNITISSPIPVNFIPKDIEFKVTNGQLTETILVRQLPPTYYQATKGVQSLMPASGNPTSDETRNQLPSGNNNPYMYSITTLAPSGDIVVGFPPLDTQGQTINSAEVANMVSPKFEMASQFGASQPKSYTNAQKQCRGYWEKAEDGTIKTGWRLPTEAEIKYIDDLQHNSNNPQGVVMAGKYYWDAYSGNNAYTMKSPTASSSATSTNAHVRCIRDIKD